MTRSKLVTTVLVAAGALLIVIGLSITLSPAAFYQSYGIELNGNATLSSELRAPAGMLLSLGVLIFCGGFIRSLTQTALLLASMLYLSYGTARAIGLLAEGLANEAIIQATVIELMVGGICLASWAYHQKRVAAQD